MTKHSPTFKVLINTKGEKIGIIFLNHAHAEALYNSTEMVQFLGECCKAGNEPYPSYQLFHKEGEGYFLVVEPYDTEEFWKNATPVAMIKYYDDEKKYVEASPTTRVAGSYRVKIWSEEDLQGFSKLN